MIYRNIHSGRKIVIPSVLTSPDWERVEAEKPQKKEKAVKNNGKGVRTDK